MRWEVAGNDWNRRNYVSRGPVRPFVLRPQLPDQLRRKGPCLVIDFHDVL